MSCQVIIYSHLDPSLILLYFLIFITCQLNSYEKYYNFRPIEQNKRHGFKK